jgi:plastocyanin
MNKRIAGVVVLMAVATGVSACGGSSGGATTPAAGQLTASPAAGGTQTVTIEGTDMFRFSPMNISAHVGTVRITLTDSGSYPHDIDFPELHQMSSTVTGDAGSSSTSLTLHLTKPGRYPFECTFHDSAGMKGVLTVTA